jgi:hypothetical protein
VVEDFEGSGVRVCIFDTKTKEIKEGEYLAISEPNFKEGTDYVPLVRVDNPKEVILNIKKFFAVNK